MKVDQISAHIRMSRQMPDNTWATVELGAEATVDFQEEWIDAQAQLYQELRDQLRTLWLEKVACRQDGPGQGQRIDTGSGEITTTDDPVCPKHHKSSQSDHGGLWCPSREADGKWCSWREAKPTKSGPINIPPRP